MTFVARENSTTRTRSRNTSETFMVGVRCVNRCVTRLVTGCVHWRHDGHVIELSWMCILFCFTCFIPGFGFMNVFVWRRGRWVMALYIWTRHRHVKDLYLLIFYIIF